MTSILSITIDQHLLGSKPAADVRFSTRETLPRMVDWIESQQTRFKVLAARIAATPVATNPLSAVVAENDTSRIHAAMVASPHVYPRIQLANFLLLKIDELAATLMIAATSCIEATPELVEATRACMAGDPMAWAPLAEDPTFCALFE